MDDPPRVLCEDCGDLITYVGGTRYHGQSLIAVGMVNEPGGNYTCGCPETPERWEIRHDGPDANAEPSQDDPTWMHPDGCRCRLCLEESNP